MKKKTVSPIIYLAIIFFACMVLTLVSNHIGAANNQPQKSESRDIRAEHQNNDFMIWESASHHLLSISR